MAADYDALLTVLSVSADAVVLLDERGHICYTNSAIELLFGYRPEELAGKGIEVLQPESLRAKHTAGFARHLATGDKRLDWRATETFGLHREGHEVPIEIGFSRIVMDGRQIFAGFMRDISARKHAQAMLAGQNRILSLIASGMPLGGVLDQTARWIESVFSGILCSILLLDASGKRLLHGAAPSLPAQFVAAVDGKEIGPGQGSCGTAVFLKQLVVVDDIGSDPLWTHYRDHALPHGLRACWSMPVVSSAGTVLGSFAMYYREPRKPSVIELEGIGIAASLVGIGIERKRADEQLAQLAQLDTLTGLPNRNLFKDRLAQAVSRAHREEWLTALVFIDLDHFKEINDTLGHAAGDEVLKAVGERLRDCMREGDTLARLGGDEFTVILEDLKAGANADTVAQKFLAALRQPLRTSGQELALSASMGIALYPQDGVDAESLLMHADTAMYHAKAEGRDSVQRYAADMSAKASERVTLEAGLRQGLQRNEFVLHYQPIFDLRTMDLIGAEALVRWNRPGRGLVGPAEFIAGAERTGLIVPLGEWVMHEACRQAAAWSGGRNPPLRLSINLSARQFRRGGLSSTLRACLSDHKIPGERLMMEITESLLMENPEGSRRLLEGMKAQGVAVALDDFGTGYSSLSYLRQFPLDTVKIDRSFVRDVIGDPEDATIVRAIIDLGHNLGLKLTAEGVETQEQLDFLRLHGCDAAQGFFLGRPVPAEIFEGLMH